MRALVCATALTGLILFPACGDDDDDNDAQPYVEALTKRLSDPDTGGLQSATADCVAKGVVDAIGVDALKDGDVTPKKLADADDLKSLDIKLPDDLEQKLKDKAQDCDLGADQKQVAVESFTADTSISPEAKECLAQNMDETRITDLLVPAIIDSSARSSDDLAQVIFDAVKACDSVMTDMLLGEAQATASPELKSCVSAYVAANHDLVGTTLTAEDSADYGALGVGLAQACPELEALPTG